MTPLISALSHWKGRRYVQQRFEESGYLIPRAFQGAMVQSCTSDSREGLERYWDERANEWVCAGGRCSPNLRQFKGEFTYRSTYLDQLAAEFDYSDERFKNHDIHPCLHEFDKRWFKNPKLMVELFDEMEERKLPEIQALNTSSVPWRGLKDTREILHQRLALSGFQKRGKSWQKITEFGLMFRCWADMGSSSGSIQLPIDFFISHASDEDWVFPVTETTPLIPGSRYYGLFSSPASAVLGIYAKVELFNILTTAF